MLLTYFDLLLQIAVCEAIMINCFKVIKYYRVAHSWIKCLHLAFEMFTLMCLQSWSCSWHPVLILLCKVLVLIPVVLEVWSWNLWSWSCLGLWQHGLDNISDLGDLCAWTLFESEKNF